MVEQAVLLLAQAQVGGGQQIAQVALEDGGEPGLARGAACLLEDRGRFRAVALQQQRLAARSLDPEPHLGVALLVEDPPQV